MKNEEVAKLVEAATEHANEGTVEGWSKAVECLVPIQQEVIRRVIKKVPVEVEGTDCCDQIAEACDKLAAVADTATDGAAKIKRGKKAKAEAEAEAEGEEAPEKGRDGKLLAALAELVKTLAPFIKLFFNPAT